MTEENKQHPISKALGVSPEKIENTVVDLTTKDETTKDFEMVRDNTYKLLSKSMKAVDELADIASYTQDHAAYQSFALLVKTAAQVNRDLMNLTFRREVINQGSMPTSITSNNTIVMTTADVQKMLEKKS